MVAAAAVATPHDALLVNIGNGRRCDKTFNLNLWREVYGASADTADQFAAIREC